MRAQSSARLGVIFGLLPAVVAAFTVRAIYQEGNVLSSAVALLAPVLVLVLVHEGSSKRVVSVLAGLLVASPAMLLWIAFVGHLSPFALLTIALVAVVVPIAFDLILLDSGTRLPVSEEVARSALVVFLAAFVPLSVALIRSGHPDVVRKDEALIREVAQHVQVQKNAIVFDRIDPRRKAELKNRLAVRAMGKTYQLSNAHFESVSEERTVKKRTEKRGMARTTEVTRERAEQMRIVVHLGSAARPENIVVFSTRGPLTIAEQQVELPGEEAAEDPVS